MPRLMCKLTKGMDVMSAARTQNEPSTGGPGPHRAAWGPSSWKVVKGLRRQKGWE